MPNTSQQPDKDTSKALLGLATRLSEQLLKSQNPMQEQPQESPTEPSQAPETAPGSEETLDLEEIPEEPIEEVPEEEPSFVADLKSMITEGFENIKGLFKKEKVSEEPKEEPEK